MKKKPPTDVKNNNNNNNKIRNTKQIEQPKAKAKENETNNGCFYLP